MLTEPRIIKDVTFKGAMGLLSTPLWPGGPAWQALQGIASADLPTSARDVPNTARVLDFWLTDYNPSFGNIIFGDCPFTVRGGKVLCPSPSVRRQWRTCGRVARGFATMVQAFTRSPQRSA